MHSHLSPGVHWGTRWQRMLVASIAVAAVLFGATTMTALAAAPTVTSVSPTHGPVAGGTTVTITGTGFTGATTVSFGTTHVTIPANASDTSITVNSPAHLAGVVDVTVTNASLTSATGAADQYTYDTAPTPAVSSVSPSTGTTAGGTLVTISGTGLSFATSVMFGSNAAAIATNTDTAITVTSPASATTGPVDVTVTTAGGTSPLVANDHFTYTQAAPVVTNVSPSSGPAAGGTTVTITGTGFTGTTSVSFGATTIAATASNATTIVVVTPLHAAGTVDVRVTANSLTSATNGNDQFTFGTSPTVTSVSPTGGGIAGGTVVTITGTGFTGATSVTFGGTAATIFTVNGDTSITATSPAHAVGTADVIVTTPAGTSTNTAADDFTYTNLPIVTSLSPAGGPIGGGTTVTVTGSNFTGATNVTFGGISVTPTNVTATSLTAVSPAHAAGVVDVLVTTPQGTSANTTADNYTYGAVPVVTAISPTTGALAGGTTVTVTGTGFTGATAALVDGNSVSVSNVTDTSLTLVTPAHAQGTVDIQVVTPLGTSATSSADQFTFGSAPTTSYTLYFRWSLIVWAGVNGINVDAALKGQETPDNANTNDISGSVTAIFRYNNASQKFEGWFPNSSGIPGANDFTTLIKGQAYWFAISTNPSVTWTVVAG